MNKCECDQTAPQQRHLLPPRAQIEAGQHRRHQKPLRTNEQRKRGPCVTHQWYLSTVARPENEESHRAKEHCLHCAVCVQTMSAVCKHEETEGEGNGHCGPAASEAISEEPCDQSQRPSCG